MKNQSVAASQIGEFLEAIKFSHSIFALPFAMLAMLLARRGKLPTLAEAGYIVGCMISARTWAMGMNRLVDAKLDGLNPRTASRALPAGRISTKKMVIPTIFAAVLFCFFASMLSTNAFFLSFPVLAILAAYSYMKRFTYFCHFWLGMCLGLAPLGVWVALKNALPFEIFTLSVSICFWVSGFDILYALQDFEIDKILKLHSIPSRFGVQNALNIARICHFFALCGFLFFGKVFGLGYMYFVGVLISAILMLWEHFILRRGKLENINLAFFNLNGWIAVIIFGFVGLSLLFES